MLPAIRRDALRSQRSKACDRWVICCRIGETSIYLFEQVLEEAHFGGFDCFVIYFHPDSCTEVESDASYEALTTIFVSLSTLHHLGDRSNRRRH